jgi:hypothetical protein
MTTITRNDLADEMANDIIRKIVDWDGFTHVRRTNYINAIVLSIYRHKAKFFGVHFNIDMEDMPTKAPFANVYYKSEQVGSYEIGDPNLATDVLDILKAHTKMEDAKDRCMVFLKKSIYGDKWEPSYD